MKRTKLELKLRPRLALIRDTLRELTPTQLRQVNGGDTTLVTNTCPSQSCITCDPDICPPCGNPWTM
jgi:hypothetical protein